MIGLYVYSTLLTGAEPRLFLQVELPITTLEIWLESRSPAQL